MEKQKRTWILVADGARARILLHDGQEIEPVALKSYVGNRRPSREIGSDKPGRTFESADGSRHSYAPRVDWHGFEKHLFARRMVAVLEDASKRGAFDALILVAPPKALGELRAALGPALHTRLRGEVAKDLTNLSDNEVAQHLSGLSGI